MNNSIIRYGFILILFIIMNGCVNHGLEIYVSPIGNDQSNGDISDPVASLQKAIEIAKPNTGKIPITINLLGGNYYLTKPITINSEDCSNEENPIYWKALPGEKPIISGGMELKNWVNNGNGLWTTNLPKEFSGKFRSLYINERRAIRARHPNIDVLRIEKSGTDNKTNFYFKSGDIPYVDQVRNLELVFYHDWSISRIGVKHIDFKNNNLETVDSIGARSPSFFTITNWEKNPRYFLENSIEFCDTPGEWFCDFVTDKVYYYPFPDEDIENIKAVIPLSSKLLTIEGSKKIQDGFISFEGITFEYTNWEIPKRGYCGIQACMFDNRESDKKNWGNVPAAIELDYVSNITFNNCEIKHTDGSGIWIRENCDNCELTNTHIFDISGNGIGIGEGQDRQVNGSPWWKINHEQVSNNNKIRNSLVEECGRQFFGAVGIWCGLVSNTLIDHNEIRNLPYTGISVGWMWDTISTPCRRNIISSNYIHHVMNKLSDGGGIYFLGKQPGSKITNNLIHDVKINAGRAESNGMFLDEGITDLVIENNIIYNIARSPIRFHRASSNMVKSNILMCDINIPPIRYNNTKENEIKKMNNMILSVSSTQDNEKLKKLVSEKMSKLNFNIKEKF